MKNADRPRADQTVDGRKIIYPIWRDDLAEATILERKEEKEWTSDQ